MNKLPKFYICSNEKQYLETNGYENFLLVAKGERVALNPKYVRRIHELVDAYSGKIILVSRSKIVSTILEACGYPYETLYM